MWKSLRDYFTSPYTPNASVAPATDGVVHIYRVQRQHELPRDVASLLPETVVLEGGLSRSAIIGVFTQLLDPGVDLSVEIFRPNVEFAKLFHDVMGRYALERADLQEEARLRGSGAIYLIDPRTAAPDGLVPPEDIIGRFRVSDGTLVADSYEPNPNYQFLSSRGWFKLDPEVGKELMSRLWQERARG